MVNSLNVFVTLLQNTLKSFAEKLREAFHIFSTKNVGLFEIPTFEILTKY